MDACCEQKAEEIKTLRGEHRKVLIVVLVINAVLFVVEAGAGLLAHSTALLADSLDMAPSICAMPSRYRTIAQRRSLVVGGRCSMATS